MASSDAAVGLDATKYKLKAFENAAAGHDGVLSDEDGEVLIKPCTQAEIDFYQASALSHPDFYAMMPTFLGTLQLSAATTIPDDPTTAAAEPEISEASKDQTLLHGKALATETAIVLANLEHGFTRPNVLDLKLGARLYDPATTHAEKAARLDGVAGKTTSGTLHFRITGMKCWNASTGSYDVYDKFYGRAFTAENITAGFATFLAGLLSPRQRQQASVAPAPATTTTTDARQDQVLQAIRTEVGRARRALEQAESRFYGASVLVVYEGDAEVRASILAREEEIRTMRSSSPAAEEEKVPPSAEDDDEEDEDEDEAPVTHRVKVIDFAHAAWTPGAGPDENVILGLKNIEDQLDRLIAQS